MRKMAAKAVRASASSIDNKQQQVWSRQRGSDLARLNEQDDAELKAFDAEMDDCATRLRDAEEALKRVREELECEITKAEDDERARDQKPVAALDATDEEKAEDCREDEFCAARSPRFEALRCLHFVDATRVHQMRSGVVSFPFLGPFGPRSTGDAPRRSRN